MAVAGLMSHMLGRRVTCLCCVLYIIVVMLFHIIVCTLIGSWFCFVSFLINIPCIRIFLILSYKTLINNVFLSNGSI